MIVHTIASGSYQLSPQKNEMMQAFLGSCVGVTICDRKAGVGGLIHLLLPEPPSRDLNWNPEVSAVTGMPIFIEALRRLGARKEHMEACIAGGALIDPVSQTDLLLDIGGRTAEIAQQILVDEGITILHSEIGGYFSCCLSLNLMTWKSSVEPIAIPAPPADDLVFSQPSREQIDFAIENLLPIPQIALKIIRMVGDDNISFSKIAHEVIQDQVLSARLIKLCNSVSIHSRMKVDSIEKALLRIGEKSLLLLALAFSMENFISHGNQGYSLCKGGIFTHSVWTATISRKLAELTGKAPPDIAYTAGLLHDIGKVVLDQYMHAAYPLFYRRMQNDTCDLIGAEKELFGIAHTQAGYQLARRWDIPDFITDTIRYHHDPQRAVSNAELIHLIYLADLFSSRFMLGQEIEKMNTAYFTSSLEFVGFDPTHFSALFSDVSFASCG
jgi:putative nucleotidyltransferase with HDIG domain